MDKRVSKAAAMAEASGTAAPPGMDADGLIDAVRNPWQDPVPSLLEALASDNPAVRSQAALLLREVPSQRAVLPLAEALLRDTDDSVRAEAAETLGMMGAAASAAVPALVVATEDKSDLVRLCAAEALGTVGNGNPEASDALIHLLDDDYSLVQLYAVEALGYLGDRTLVPILKEKMTESWPEVRVWYRFALFQLGEPFDFQDVLGVLRRGGYTSRLQAATVLRLAVTDENEARIVASLRRALGRERNPNVREHLERLLVDLGVTPTPPADGA